MIAVYEIQPLRCISISDASYLACSAFQSPSAMVVIKRMTLVWTVEIAYSLKVCNELTAEDVNDRVENIDAVIPIPHN